LFCEVDADLFDLVDVFAACVDAFAGPAFRVTVPKIREYCFSYCWAGNVLAGDEWEGIGEPLVVLF